MLEKIMGKRKKEVDIFQVPEKKYTTDQKIIGKMSLSSLKDLSIDQEKYVNVLIEKVISEIMQIENAKHEYDRLSEKIEELQ